MHQGGDMRLHCEFIPKVHTTWSKKINICRSTIKLFYLKIDNDTHFMHQ